jgi:hypothetical protein
MTGRRFAEDTRVPIGRTQAEIKDRLRKSIYGALLIVTLLAVAIALACTWPRHG